jgi:hypothetical protein
MVRLMIACLALCAAAPAAAQTSELPVWLVGYWCTEEGATQVCIRYEPPKDGAMRATNVMIRDGQPQTFGSISTTRIEDGIVVRRASTSPAVLREISHGPTELLMERVNPMKDQAVQIRYTVDGDVLTVEFTMDDGSHEVQRYRRMPDGS